MSSTDIVKPMMGLWEDVSPEPVPPSSVLDAFWSLAAERLRLYLDRVRGARGSMSSDPIVRTYRFTNAYRACDRVSQHLIREVQYGFDQSPDEVIFRTILFKIFNKIDTWELLAARQAPSLANFDPDDLAVVLSDHMAHGNRIYSAAYIVPPVLDCPRPKHLGHLRLIAKMLDDDLPGRVRASGSLADVFWLLRAYSGIGDFLGFQLAVDISYSTAVPFDDGGYVVAGPGAVDGISKCFPGTPRAAATSVIRKCCDLQEEEFHRRGIHFPGLFGRRLQPVDVQNLFCEISKYSRVAFPGVTGTAGRTRIKQRYTSAGPLPTPFFPPKWGLRLPPSLGGFDPECASGDVCSDGAARMSPKFVEGAVTDKDGFLPLGV